MKIENQESYVLPLFATQKKLDELGFACFKYRGFVNEYIEDLFKHPEVKHYSTKGLGTLANQAQRYAIGQVKAIRALKKEKPDQKISCPVFRKTVCPAEIWKQSTHKHFNFILKFYVGFSDDRAHGVHVYSNGYKQVKKKIRDGWILSRQCQIFLGKNGKWYVRIYLSKKVKKAIPKKHTLGVDVGVNHGIATSEGFKSNSLFPSINRTKRKNIERKRQRQLAFNRENIVLFEKLTITTTKKYKVTKKSKIKQQIDKLAHYLVTRSAYLGCNLAVEDPKCLANLKFTRRRDKTGGLNLWARSYLAHRVQVLAKERGVFVVFVSPYNTSLTCVKCGHKDRQSRVDLGFNCTKCGHADHADLNAAKNIAYKGQEFVDIYVLKVKPKTQKISAIKAP